MRSPVLSGLRITRCILLGLVLSITGQSWRLLLESDQSGWTMPERDHVLIGKERTADHISNPISQMLETIRVKHQFPALAAVVVVDGEIVATNAVGFRKHGSTEAATVQDKFHIGSVTKSMTATIAAMLVEQGKICWTSTIGESFPDYGNQIHPDYRDVTLEQLLRHRGGAPGDAPNDLWIEAWNGSGSHVEQRLGFVKGILARKPEAKPGANHIYSNQGYAIAGVMLEKTTGKPWEELMQSMLFEPLGMKSAGFGAPATPGKIDQPWGHTKDRFTGIRSVPPGPRADNPPAIGPAGTVHCSLPDLARYAMFHLSGARGDSQLLNAESFKKLHASAGDDSALGWFVLEREWAGGRALTHNGSNTMFYMVIWMAPERNGAVIVGANIGAGFAGCDEAVAKLIQQFFPTPRGARVVNEDRRLLRVPWTFHLLPPWHRQRPSASCPGNRVHSRCPRNLGSSNV
jgi:CubicO group peptidase (beta-lactamase class C family)